MDLFKNLELVLSCIYLEFGVTAWTKVVELFIFINFCFRGQVKMCLENIWEKEIQKKEKGAGAVYHTKNFTFSK